MKVKELKKKLDEFDDDLDVVFHVTDEEELGETGKQYPFCMADHVHKHHVKGGRDEDRKISFQTVYPHQTDDPTREVVFVDLTAEF